MKTGKLQLQRLEVMTPQQRLNAILYTITVRKLRSDGWAVQSPLFADTVTLRGDREEAIAAFITCVKASLWDESNKKLPTRGRPKKYVPGHSLHTLVSSADKLRFEEIAQRYGLTQGEAVVFLLNCFDIFRENFLPFSEVCRIRNSADVGRAE